MGTLKTLLSYNYDVRDLYRKQSSIIETKSDPVTPQTYEFEEVDISKLLNIYQTIRYRTNNGNIRLAFDRYLLFFEKRSQVDKLIDLCVAVEALFSKDEDIHGSLTHKYSLRLTRFINEDPKKRAETYIRMSRLYGQRSAVIHANKTTVTNIDRLKDYVSNCLIKYLNILSKNPRMSHDAIVEQIDYE